MPPPAPRTATLVWRAADEENWRDWVSARREERANMVVVVVNGEEVEGGDERGERQTRETLEGLYPFGAARTGCRITPAHIYSSSMAVTARALATTTILAA